VSRGFLLFAHNNPEIDYGLIALICARLIKAHLRENTVCLATDEGTLKWLYESRGRELVNVSFDEIKIIQKADPLGVPDSRIFHDSPSTARSLPWHNATRPSAYAITPFDETILLDTDYLVMDRALDALWGGPDEVMIPRRTLNLNGSPATFVDRRISEHGGIPMRWATMIYFRKSPVAESLFALADHIRMTYGFWKQIHSLPGRLYRNDFAFALASHLLSGQTDGGTLIPDVPGPPMLNSSDRDDLYAIPEAGSLVFLCEDANKQHRVRAVRTDGLSVHAMNKFSICRHADRLIDLHKARQ